MGFVVVTNIEQAQRIMERFPAKANKALSQAVHFAAKIAQGHVIAELPQHFHIRSQWVPGSIRLRTIDNTTVAVGVSDKSAFMVLQETGGEKKDKLGMPSNLQHPGRFPMAVPIGGASSYATGDTSPAFRGSDQMGKTLQSRWPSHLQKTFIIKTNSGKNIVVQVVGKGKRSHLRVIYIIKKRVKIKPRWNFVATVTSVAKDFVPRLFMGYLGRHL